MIEEPGPTGVVAEMPQVLSTNTTSDSTWAQHVCNLIQHASKYHAMAKSSMVCMFAASAYKSLFIDVDETVCAHGTIFVFCIFFGNTTHSKLVVLNW
jgi:hypothetical protein